MIILHRKPLSLNQMYPTNRQGRRFATAESKAYKQELGVLAKRHYTEFVNYADPLSVVITILGPITKKDGSLSMTALDLDNCAKPIIDGLADALGFNDAIVTDLYMTKTQFSEWRVYVSLLPAPRDPLSVT